MTAGLPPVPTGLQLDLATACVRMEQVRQEGWLNSDVVADRILTCDLPRLRGYLSPATLEWMDAVADDHSLLLEPATRTAREVDQIAAAVAEQLHAGLLQIPAEVARQLKQYSGFLNRWNLAPTPHLLFQARILTNGGLELELLANGYERLWQGVLQP